MLINLNNKVFRLLSNSDHGAVSGSTIFHYKQLNGKVTASYSGGEVIDGQILAAWRSPDQLEMRYQCIMKDHTLKAGKAIAKVKINDVGLIELHLDWQWLGGNSERGTSVYIEVS